jgi:hypothetical protein
MPCPVSTHGDDGVRLVGLQANRNAAAKRTLPPVMREFSIAFADAARTYLVDKGISPSRIKARGFGKSRPIASNKVEAGRAENRRMEIIAE